MVLFISLFVCDVALLYLLLGYLKLKNNRTNK